MTKKNPRYPAYKLLTAFFLGWILIPTVCLAESSPPTSADTKNTVQPEASALDPVPADFEKSQEALKASVPAEKSPSTAFLMNDSPLTILGENTKIIFPVSQSCSESKPSSGDSTCLKVYSDGSVSKIRTHQESEDKEFRQITTLEETDAEDNLKGVKNIYQGTQYSDAERSSKDFEFFEIIHEEIGSPRSKEILIYDYYPGTHQVKKVTWGEYTKNSAESEEKLISHAFLTYHPDGTPNKGLAESLEDGYLTAQFLKGTPDSGETRRSLDQEAWRGWENWITTRRISLYIS